MSHDVIDPATGEVAPCCRACGSSVAQGTCANCGVVSDARLRELLAGVTLPWLYSERRHALDMAQLGGDGQVYDGESLPVEPAAGRLIAAAVNALPSLLDRLAPVPQEEIDALLSKTAAICVFCGAVYPSTTEPERIEFIRAHMLECERHPVYEMVTGWRAAVDALELRLAAVEQRAADNLQMSRDNLAGEEQAQAELAAACAAWRQATGCDAPEEAAAEGAHDRKQTGELLQELDWLRACVAELSPLAAMEALRHAEFPTCACHGETCCPDTLVICPECHHGSVRGEFHYEKCPRFPTDPRNRPKPDRQERIAKFAAELALLRELEAATLDYSPWPDVQHRSSDRAVALDRLRAAIAACRATRDGR